jgi:hypothetical protein
VTRWFFWKNALNVCSSTHYVLTKRIHKFLLWICVLLW